MKRVIKLENLDCANCAAKMEDGARKVEGVKSVSISFMTQKMTIETEDDCFDKVIAQVKKVCKKIEPDCEILA